MPGKVEQQVQRPGGRRCSWDLRRGKEASMVWGALSVVCSKFCCYGTTNNRSGLLFQGALKEVTASAFSFLPLFQVHLLPTSAQAR